jgi:hypothetical protein
MFVNEGSPLDCSDARPVPQTVSGFGKLGVFIVVCGTSCLPKYR